MLVGPVFTREWAIAPRRLRLYAARTVYAAALLVLILSSWLVLTGTQNVRDLGDLARFGAMLFQILAPLQLALALFFSALLSASAVAQEKDRRTLILLLLTRLSNSELVLGKLLAALLQVFVMLAAALPVFMLTTLLGGVAFAQIGRVFAVTLTSVLVCGSLGSTIALWREKTFQSLSMTILAIVAWLAFWEAVDYGAFGPSWMGISCHTLAAGCSPWRAVLVATLPFIAPESTLGLFGSPVYLFLATSLTATLLLNLVAVALVRVWNPSRETFRDVRVQEPEGVRNEGIWAAVGESSTDAGPRPARAVNVHATDLPTRHVWDNPVLWREVRTWAYGRKVLLIRAAYLVLFGLAAWGLHAVVAAGTVDDYAQGAVIVLPVLLLSLVMVNTQAVTAMTSERDVATLDLVLVTDLTPKEIIFGKLGGVFYNTMEMIALPLLLCGYLAYAELISIENTVYLVLGLGVMYVFVAMLGLHAGMIYQNSRHAVAVSLGTVFFLFIGVATCMRIMIAFSGTFQAQLLPFAAMFIVGGVGLYLALGARNPSTAIAVASLACPFATFYAITSYMLGATLAVFLVTAAAYGFTTAAMLIPAIYEFDVATGKSTFDEQ